MGWVIYLFLRVVNVISIVCFIIDWEWKRISVVSWFSCLDVLIFNLYFGFVKVYFLFSYGNDDKIRIIWLNFFILVKSFSRVCVWLLCF